MSHTVNNKSQKTLQEEKFINEVTSSPEGRRVLSCIQCGTCTATCPVAKVFGHSPRHLFLMVRNGRKKEALSDLTPWVCASCFRCTVNCPAQIKITEVMYRLKRMSIKNNITTKDSDAAKFYSAFLKLIMKYGRSYEIGLMLKYMAFNHTIDLVKQIPTGMSMMMSGAMPVFPHKIKNRKEFAKIVTRAIELEEENIMKN